MADFIVSIDGSDHQLGEDETTACGIVVPHGTAFTREPGESPCPVCFPETAEAPKPKGKKKA